MPDPSPRRLMLLSGAPDLADIASRLQQQGCEVTIASDLRRSLPLLQQQPYDLILLEDAIAAASPLVEWDAWQEACAGALILELNLALATPGRILREVKLALARQQRYELLANKAAAHRLRDELSASVAGILLQSQLLLNQSQTPSRAALEQIATLAESLSHGLRNDETPHASPICIP